MKTVTYKYYLVSHKDKVISDIRLEVNETYKDNHYTLDHRQSPCTKGIFHTPLLELLTGKEHFKSKESYMDIANEFLVLSNNKFIQFRLITSSDNMYRLIEHFENGGFKCVLGTTATDTFKSQALGIQTLPL